MKDRVGIGWRPELAAGILANLDQIDLIEVIADDLFDADRRHLRGFRTLARQVPLELHGVSLGLASAAPVDVARLDAMARAVALVEPEGWSEHLAFVRGGHYEIGHLAAPPRTAATIDGTAKNLARARSVVGSMPKVENIATLIDAPASDRSESAWVSDILRASGAPLLLDLHNLLANATNFRFDAFAFLDAIPLGAVRAVHLAGGRFIPGPLGRERLLDDHRHDVPETVYALLVELGRRCEHPLDVVLERDGNYPPFEHLLAELAHARAALAEGRAAKPRRRFSERAA